MNSLCPLILSAMILANVVGDIIIERVDVTCQHKYNDRKICTVPHVDLQSKAPSILNILNADASKDTIHFKMIEGHYAVMPMNLFQLFAKLEQLEISTGLEAITKENLIGANKLKELIITDNKISTITPHTFDGMVELELIDLENNTLTKVEVNAFAGAINLKSLRLGSNAIDTIECGAFNIPTLEEINLDHNKLQTLADNVFVFCPELEIISLYGNELTRIGKSIDNVPKLFQLLLNSNNVKIIDFDFYATARKPDLENLIAESVGLSLDDPAPVDVANVNYTAVHLDISGNNLSHPDILHRLRNFRNLITLELSNNNFTTISDIESISEMFPKLHKLYVNDVPCKDEIIQRLRTKFGDRVTVLRSKLILI